MDVNELVFDLGGFCHVLPTLHRRTVQVRMHCECVRHLYDTRKSSIINLNGLIGLGCKSGNKFQTEPLFQFFVEAKLSKNMCRLAQFKSFILKFQIQTGLSLKRSDDSTVCPKTLFSNRTSNQLNRRTVNTSTWETVLIKPPGYRLSIF